MVKKIKRRNGQVDHGAMLARSIRQKRTAIIVSYALAFFAGWSLGVVIGWTISMMGR